MAKLKKLNGTKSSDPTLSAAATRVSLSVRQENGEVTKTRVTCGLGYDTPLANYDPGTQSWKMCEAIYLWAEPMYLATLPASGMTRNGVLYQQPAWEPITSETELLSWPTPRANSAMASTITQETAHDPKRFPNLETVVGRRLWPTPTAVTRPMEGNVRLYRAKIEAGEMTEAEAEAILGKSVWKAQGKVKEKWPTPTHGKLAGGSGAFQKIADLYSDGAISDEERKAMQAGNGGKLNPTWVEWLMGFPTGWTDLKD
jgi:DNA (cytosine-5)-methyltransferase 1